jgi:hypothetical protein
LAKEELRKLNLAKEGLRKLNREKEEALRKGNIVKGGESNYESRK